MFSRWCSETGLIVVYTRMIQIVNSLPPVWGQKAPYGSLGTFQGGDVITLQLTALVSTLTLYLN